MPARIVTYPMTFTRPRAARPTPAAVINAAVFIATVIPVAIVPLLPRISERLGIGPVQAGVLLAAPNFAMVIVSIPSGLIADRVGARTVTRIAAVLLTLATLGQALATNYGTMLAARLLVGVAYGIIWTTALAWLAELRTPGEDDDHRGVAASTTSGGVGLIAAPAIAGMLVGVLGISGSFLFLAAVAAAVAAALFAIDRGARGAPEAVAGGRAAVGDAVAPSAATAPAAAAAPGPAAASGAEAAPGLASSPSAPSAIMAAGREPMILSGGIALVLIGLTTGMLNLLAPLELRAAGISASSIGFAFMGAAGLYIVASGLVVRVGGQMIRVTTLGVALVAMAAAMMPAAASVSAIAVGATLLLQSPFRATVATVSYPRRGERRAGAARCRNDDGPPQRRLGGGRRRQRTAAGR